MAVEEQFTPAEQETTARASHKRGRGAAVFTLLLLGLVIIGSAFLFAWRGGRTVSMTAVPAAGKWSNVLTGYAITQVVAAHDNPALLYACATKMAPGDAVSNTSPPASYVVLRSTDYGEHWQETTSTPIASGSCTLALNRERANELFVVGVLPGVKNTPMVLRVSSDSGASWKTIQPTIKNLATINVRPQPAWQAEQVEVVGQRLFAVQQITDTAITTIKGRPSIMRDGSRLMRSDDGGQTWTILNEPFQKAGMTVRTYAVASADQLYLIASRLWPLSSANQDPSSQGIMASNETLYKSVDGGLNWQTVSSDLPYNSWIRIAAGKPETLYVGSTQRIMNVSPEVNRGRRSIFGRIALRVSQDGGAHWREVEPPNGNFPVQNWQVDATGLLYVVVQSGGVVPGGDPENIQPLPITPGSSNQSGGAVPPGQKIPKKGIADRYDDTAGTVTPPTGSTPPSNTPTTSIWSYDPASSKWMQVTQVPAGGYATIIALTDQAGSNKAILWVQGIVNEKMVLYRYVV